MEKSGIVKVLKGVIVMVLGVVVLYGTMGASSARANDFALPLEMGTQDHIVGMGVGVLPDYEGSDDYTFGIAPFLKYKFTGREQYISFVATELRVNVLNHPWLRLGPSLNYRFGRDDVEDDKVDDMKDIDDTLEAGGFIGVEFVNKDNPRKRFVANLDVLTDIGGEHDGTVATLTARVWYPLAMMFDVTLGGALTYASENYMETYFGVDKKDSLRSGLKEYEADGGLKDFRLNTSIVMHLSPHWHLAAGIQYKRLVGDAEDSPVVDDRGDANQWLGGVGLAYSW